MMQAHPTERLAGTFEASLPILQACNRSPTPARHSWRITTSLVLIYVFTFSDFVLKFLPFNAAIVLRYVPEFILYCITMRVFLSEQQRFHFPLFPPLLMFGLSTALTGLINDSPAWRVLSDFRTYWRFACFTFIIWATRLSRRQVKRITSVLLVLAALQNVIGVAQLFGGAPLRVFFAPALQWASGSASVRQDLPLDGFGWIAGTLSNYNHFGIFMVLCFALAMCIYLNRRHKNYLAIAICCAMCATFSLSRHSMLALAMALSLIYAVRRNLLWVFAVVSLAVFVMLVIAPGYEVAPGEAVGLGQRLASALSHGVLSGDPREDVRLYLMKQLPGRLLQSHPLFGQGPGIVKDLSDTPWLSDKTTHEFEGTGDMPSWTLMYVPDIVWLLMFGVYGLSGVASYWYVLGTIARSAWSLRRKSGTELSRAISEAGLVFVAVYILTGFF